MSFEAVPLIDGKPAWSYHDHKDDWDRLGKIANDVGLAWGGDNARFKAYP
ncbi:MAG: M15 family metallopeptidase, partial [Desulfobacteraceae bacterium]|nr:M15 family metallopeptidase [Desulfobacteraceae bacterium]